MSIGWRSCQFLCKFEIFPFDSCGSCGLGNSRQGGISAAAVVSNPQRGVPNSSFVHRVRSSRVVGGSLLAGKAGDGA